MKKGILLIKSSNFQNYLANSMFANDMIDEIILEEGTSLRNKVYLNFNNFFENLRYIINPKNLYFKIYQLLNYHNFYGATLFHNKRILGNQNIILNDKIKITKTNSINSIEVKNYLFNKKFKYIYIFGTSLIDLNIYKELITDFINVHWGYSQSYRGEGIVSCISNNDFNKLGVTIHFLSKTIDQGKIIKQKLINIDKYDNFYSIGLKMTFEATKILCDKNLDTLLINAKEETDMGKLYNSYYIKKNYDIFYKAQKNLKSFKHEKNLI
tara:strand:- start:351 stop:1154 length:804 start_codon:yes stop_codon:yes gene_type:complete